MLMTLGVMASVNTCTLVGGVLFTVCIMQLPKNYSLVLNKALVRIYVCWGCLRSTSCFCSAYSWYLVLGGCVVYTT